MPQRPSYSQPESPAPGRALNYVVSQFEDSLMAQLVMIQRMDDTVKRLADVTVGLNGKLESRLKEVHSEINEVRNGLMAVMSAVKAHVNDVSRQLAASLDPRADFGALKQELTKLNDILGEQKGNKQALARLSLDGYSKKEAASHSAMVMGVMDEIKMALSAKPKAQKNDTAVAKAIEGLAAALTNREFKINRDNNGDMTGFETVSGTKH